jgi:hypothetical protein
MEKTLNLLDRIRSVIGEAEYKERIDCLAASLPNLGTYKTEVEVIVIDDDDNDVDEEQNNATNHDNDCSDEEIINTIQGRIDKNRSTPPETTPAVSKQLKRKSSL